MTPAESRSIRLAEAGLVATVVLWGSNFVALKIGLQSLPPLGLAALRFVAGALLLLGFQVVVGARRPPPGTWRSVFLLGLIGHGGYQSLFILGMSRTPAVNAAIITGLGPVFASTIGWRLDRHRPSVREVLALGLATGGALVVSAGRLTSHAGSAGHSALGDVFILGSAMVFAVYAVWFRRLSGSVDVTLLTAWSMVGGCVTLLVLAAPELATLRWNSVTAASWGALVYSAVGSLALGYLFFGRGLRAIGVSRATLVSCAAPVFGVGLACVVLGERPSVLQLGGAAVTVAGIVLARQRPATLTA